MTQSSDISLSNQSGIDFRTELNSILAAFGSAHRGSSRPSYAVAGMLWVDNTSDPEILKFYDGADDIEIASLNTTTNKCTLTNQGDATTAQGLVTVAQVQKSSIIYATTTGSANAYLVSLTPAPSAVVEGLILKVKANFTNTDAATINVNSLGVKNIRDSKGGVLASGVIQSGGIYDLVYNGTNFLMLSDSSTASIQDGVHTYIGTTSGTDTLTATAVPAITAYQTGMKFVAKVGTTNTGSVTINIDSVGAVAVKKLQEVLTSGDLVAGDMIEVVYDGTAMQLISPLHYDQFGEGGATQSSGGVDITLTSASNKVQEVTMTAKQKAVILPDATTIGEGGTIFIVKNTGSYIFKITNDSGKTVASLNPNQSLALFCVDNSTAAGIWLSANHSYDGTPLNQLHLNTLNTPVASVTNHLQATALTDTTIVVCYVEGTASKAIVGTIASDNTITFGTPMTLGSNGGITTCTALNSSQVLLTYFTSTTAFSAVVGDVAGTTLTLNTPTAISSTYSNNLNHWKSLVKFSSTSVVVSYLGSGNVGRIIAIGISGITVSVGTQVSTGHNNHSSAIVKLTSTIGLICGDQSGTNVTVRKLTLTATTIALGTALNVGTTTASTFHTGIRIDDTTALFIWSDNDSLIFARFSYSGIVCTKNSTEERYIGEYSSSNILNALSAVTLDDNNFLLVSGEPRYQIASVKNKTSVRLFTIGVEALLEERRSLTILDHLLYYVSYSNKLPPLTIMPNGNLLYTTQDSTTQYGQVAVVDYLT